MKTTLSFAFAVCVLLCSSLQAQVFDEAGLGDFSDNGGTPTALGQLFVGTNTISGTTGSNDRDHVTFSVGANEQITSFVITEFTEAGGHFFGLANGTTAPGAGSGFLIADLISSNETPFQVLGAGGGQFGGSGVPALLGAGDYTVLFNETAGVSPDYTAEIVVSAIPEPGSLAILSAGLGLIAFRRRR